MLTVGLVAQVGCRGVLDLSEKDSVDGGADSGAESDAGTGGDSGDGNDTGPDVTSGGDGDGDPVLPPDAVDLLLVIDNTSSMGYPQRGLAAVVPSMVQRLVDEGVDVRVGVTTTDNGNPFCPTIGVNDTTPEYGRLRATSCTTRPAEFEWPHTNALVEAYESTCLDGCSEEVGSTWSIAATAIDGGADLAARPWVEVQPDGESNVVGASWATALRCMVPQGVDGCGLEAPLASQWEAIAKSSDPAEAHFGFLRDDAMLAVVHLTDEADCSANPRVEALVFDQSLSDSPIWTGATVTSGACWTAGVQCTGDGMPYESCDVTDVNYLGEPVAPIDDPSAPDALQPVLIPLSRFQDQLDALPRPPVVAAFAGAPAGYEDGVTEIVYSATQGSTESETFGIDFGCEASVDEESLRAIPPVRLRELAAANHGADLAAASGLPRNVFSVCDGDISQEADRIVDLILAGVAR